MIKNSILKTDGITFKIGDKEYHTLRDLNLLWLSDLEITSPEVKRHTIDDIHGSDGVIDVTECFGPVRYKNRTITAKFEARDTNYDEWGSIRSDVCNKLHGQKARITMDTDPDYYWEGRISVSPSKKRITHSDVEIIIDAFPYKRKILYSSVKSTINPNNKTMIILNSKMPSQPTITVSSAVSLSFGTEVYALKSGDNTPDFELLEGENVFTFSGQTTNINVTVKWEEGSL